MKILMVIRNFHPIIGGAENQALLLSKQLLSREYKVEVLTRKHKNWETRETFNGISIHRFRGLPRLGRISPISDVLVTIPFLIKNRNKFDIIHLHQGVIYTLLIGQLMHIINPRIPIICKIANSGANFDLNTLNKSYPFLYKKLLLPKIKTFISYFIVISDLIKSHLSDMNIHFVKEIPNCVDYKTDKECKDFSSFRFVSTSRLSPHKNVYNSILFLENAIQPIDCSLTYDIFGDGTEKKLIQSHILNLTPSSNLKINYRGKISYGDIDYSNYNFFILLSEYEGLSNSLLEAMSHGCICITSNIPSNLEVIQDGFNGFIVDIVSDVPGQLGKILIEEKSKLLKISQNARETIEKLYSSEIIVKKYDSLYTNLSRQ